VLLLGVWAVAVSAPAEAATDKRETEAIADFAAGRYQQAIDLFAQLYGETMNPIYLRNIGRCQQGLGQPQPAIKSYREYLKKSKGMKADERKEIEGYIKEMEEMQAAQQSAANAPPPPVAAPPAASAPLGAQAPSAGAAATTAPVPQPAPAAATTSTTTTSSAPTASPAATAAPAPASVPLVSAVSSPPSTPVAHPWRVPGIVVTAVGAVLVGTGVAFGISAKNDADAVSATYDPSKADAGKRNARIGAAADVVGAAAIVTGIVLITHAGNAPAPTAFGLRAGALADSRSGVLLVAGSF
jgi:hypothetical protein